MRDAGLKKMLSEVLRNKDVIYEILNSQTPEDVAKGDVFLKEELFNRVLHKKVIEIAFPHLIDYQINFIDDHILLSADVDVKQLGAMSLSYKMKMLEFAFRPDSRNFTLEYYEQAEAKGNMLQAAMFKMAGWKKSLLKTAVDFMKKDYIKATDDLLSVDLMQSPLMSKIPERLILEWKSCRDGRLHLSFGLKDS